MAPRPRRQRTPPLVTRPAASSPAPLGIWLLVALAVPRIVRILYPYVWVEDDLYLESALAVARGLRPYIDFVHPQWPLLEWIAGGFVSLVGPSHRAMEILNGLAIYATSILIVVVGRRMVGLNGARAGALLFSCSSLVFRYHVWAREFFVVALVLGAAACILDAGRSARRQVSWAALLLVLAGAIKLTALLSVVALILFMALAQRRWLRALALGTAVGIGLLVFGAVCYRLYGYPFVFQALWFHLLKGREIVGAGPSYAGSILDVLAPLAILGAMAVATSRNPSRETWLVVAMLGTLGLFYGALSPTAWGHNYLELLPYIAILAGAGLISTIAAFRSRAWIRAVAAVVLMAGCLAGPTPLKNENAAKGSVYGFGFVPRAELAQLAGALRTATLTGDPVIAPSFIAFEAGRIQWVRYPENLGVMRAAEEAVRADGLLAARARFGASGFFDLINETSPRWNDLVIQGIAPGGPVNAFIADSPIQLLPLVNASPDALTARRFHLALWTGHFAVWVRTAGP